MASLPAVRLASLPRLPQRLVGFPGLPERKQRHRQASRDRDDGALLRVTGPDSANQSPHLRRSLSGPNGPRM